MNTPDFIDYLNELLAPLSSHHTVTHTRLFGGHSFKADNLSFALVMNNQLYFCVNDQTRPRYQAEGMTCFQYRKQNKTILVKKYYTVPEALFDEADDLIQWAEDAICAAASYPQKKG